jgi:hypothetical protein
MVRKKPHRQQSLVSWFKTRLRRPVTLKAASAVLNVINLVARIWDWFQ